MDIIKDLLGLGMEANKLTVFQVLLRAMIVFLAAIVMVRMADKRFLSRMSAVDVILGFILGSALSRAINGSAPFFATIVLGFFLVLLHKAIAWASFYSHTFGELVKGRENLLIEEGKMKTDALRANHISERDLHEELRQEGNIAAVDEVKLAYLERSGKVSVVRRKS